MAQREKGGNPSEAVFQAFHWVGSALWTTSLILIVGYIILASSGFEINSQMGILVAFTIFSLSVQIFCFYRRY